MRHSPDCICLCVPLQSEDLGREACGFRLAVICLSVNMTPPMSVCLPPSRHALLEGISNSNLTPWASLLPGVRMLTLLSVWDEQE